LLLHVGLPDLSNQGSSHQSCFPCWVGRTEKTTQKEEWVHY